MPKSQESGKCSEKNRDILNLFIQSWIYEQRKRFTLPWCLVCFVSFSMAMRTISQRYIMRERLATDCSLSIAVKRCWR